MHSLLFEQIDNTGLIRNGEVNFDGISKLTAFDIIEFAVQSRELTSAQGLPQQTGLFTHSASYSLGGSSWPCSTLECRLEKARQLAQFAAVYSDKVYIRNFIADHLRHLDGKKYPNEFMMQSELADDLAVYQSLRPLIEAGIVIPITPPHYCPNHFVEGILKDKNDRRLSKALKNLAKRYLNELQYSLRKHDDGTFHLVMTGPEDLLEYGYLAIVSLEPPPHYKKDRAVRKRLNRPGKIRLSKQMVYEMQLDIQLTDRVFQNVVFELLASQCVNTSYVTERPIDISLLNDITAQATRERDQIVRDHLTCLVPFIEDASASSILKLRNAEQEAFVRFRQALNRAVDVSLVSGKFTSADAQQVYQDILRPELSKLDARIKLGRTALLRDTSIRVGAWTAAISIGLYTGILPSELVLAAKALGLTKIVADLSEGILKNSRPEMEIKDADMYFLWKVRQSAEH